MTHRINMMRIEHMEVKVFRYMFDARAAFNYFSFFGERTNRLTKPSKFHNVHHNQITLKG